MKTLLAINWDSLSSSIAPNIAGKNIGDVINLVLPLIFYVAGVFMLFYLLLAGYKYMMSNNDPKLMEEARNNLTYAVVGFLVVFASYWAVKYLGNALGFIGKGGIF